MEILTYVLSGELEHKDSLGNGAVIHPGEVQYMAAGTGVEHSEFNPSKTDPVHLMPIWNRPDRKSVSPRYERRRFPLDSNTGGLTLLASQDGRDGSIRINQDAGVLAARIRPGQETRYSLAKGRGAWLQLLHGRAAVNQEQLEAGDGAAISGESELTIRAAHEAGILLFDLA